MFDFIADGYSFVFCLLVLVLSKLVFIMGDK